jgi:hypothetical protein
MRPSFQEIVSSARAAATEALAKGERTDEDRRDDRSLERREAMPGLIIRAVSMRIHDFVFGSWDELVRDNVWLVPPGRVVVCQKGLRPELANAVRLADAAHDSVLLSDALSAAIDERDERVRRMRKLTPGSVLVSSSRNGGPSTYDSGSAFFETDPSTGYWAGRQVVHTAVRFATSGSWVVSLDSPFVALFVEVVPDRVCKGTSDALPDVALDVEAIRHGMENEMEAEVVYCAECGAAIDPAWYGHRGYRRDDPAHVKVCDLCSASRALVPEDDGGSSEKKKEP